MMQDLLEKWNTETVPLLCEKWPEKFRVVKFISERESFLYLRIAPGAERHINPESLDSLAAVSGACGLRTWATFDTDDQDGRPYWTGGAFFGERFVFSYAGGPIDSKWYHDSTEYSDEPSARLAATIAAVAAIAGGGE